ncbi:hypothetical protein ACIQM4_33515 [Streptomyces sp. NPDC091272]
MWKDSAAVHEATSVAIQSARGKNTARRNDRAAAILEYISMRETS